MDAPRKENRMLFRNNRPLDAAQVARQRKARRIRLTVEVLALVVLSFFVAYQHDVFLTSHGLYERVLATASQHAYDPKPLGSSASWKDGCGHPISTDADAV